MAEGEETSASRQGARMSSRDLTHHAALAADILAMPANLAGYSLIIEAMLHRLESFPVKSTEFDLRHTLQVAHDIAQGDEE
jgi:hypothetical protein